MRVKISLFMTKFYLLVLSCPEIAVHMVTLVMLSLDFAAMLPAAPVQWRFFSQVIAPLVSKFLEDIETLVQNQFVIFLPNR